MKPLWACHLLFTGGHTNRQENPSYHVAQILFETQSETLFYKHCFFYNLLSLASVHPILQMRKVKLMCLGSEREGTQGLCILPYQPRGSKQA